MKKEFDFDVFMSYASEDKAPAKRIAERLKAEGLRVWFDDWSIGFGEDIYQAINHGIEESRTQLFLLSPHALESEWVSLERNTAIFRDPMNTSRRFIPVLLTTCDLPETLKRYKFVDYREEQNSAFKQLLSCCRPEDTASHVDYSYPDPGDRITLATIQTLEPMPGYWSYSEDVMRRDFIDSRLSDIKMKTNARGIDIGCGAGRLLPWLATYCHHLTALEPDPQRLHLARVRLDDNLASRIEFREMQLERLDEAATYDLVLCSHVLQHLRCDLLHSFVEKLRALCPKGGRIVVFTTHAPPGEDRFVKAYRQTDGSYREEKITSEEFDRLTEISTGQLPIRFFSFEALRTTLEEVGLELRDHYVYHCCEGNFGDIEEHCFRDTIVNHVPPLRDRFGRDMAMVATPASRT
jgi:2-polyprenyl-3-methyl-5-hydroxy-6-metoxy-1,4-benzoquinol methylase